MFIEVENIDAAELKPFWGLSENQLKKSLEPDPGYFVAESPNVIQRALAAGYEPISFLVEREQLQRSDMSFLSEANLETIPVYCAEAKSMSRITGMPLTRGALCLLRRRKLPSVAALTEGKRRIAVLEDVENPTNLGAVFRSAAALGVEAVLLTKGCSDPLYRRASRVSMGTVFQIPWTEMRSDTWQSELQSLGFQTAATALRDNTCSVSDPVFHQIERLAIILGNEGFGLAESTIDDADYTVKIPMTEGIDSLNVAAASAVVFWELCKR